MADKHKEVHEYDGPPDYIPDSDLLPGDVEKRNAAGRSYTPHPTLDWDSSLGLVPRGGKSEPKPFFGKKKGD